MKERSEPSECALNHRQVRKHLEALFAINATHDLHDEVDKRRLGEPLRSVVGAIGEPMLDPRPTFADRIFGQQGGRRLSLRVAGNLGHLGHVPSGPHPPLENRRPEPRNHSQTSNYY